MANISQDPSVIMQYGVYVAGTLILGAVAIYILAQAIRSAVRTLRPPQPQEAVADAEFVDDEKHEEQQEHHGPSCNWCDNPATCRLPTLIRKQNWLHRQLTRILPIEMTPPRYRRGSGEVRACDLHGAMAEHITDNWLAKEQQEVTRFYEARAIRAAKFMQQGLEQSMSQAVQEGVSRRKPRKQMRQLTSVPRTANGAN